MDKKNNSTVELSTSSKPQTIKSPEYSGSENNSSKSPNKHDGVRKEKFSLTSKFKNWATNINYQLDTYINTMDMELPLVLFSKRYDKRMKDMLKQKIAETIWFSYREDFPAIMPEIFNKKKLTYDRGWGCMIRCGQMMLAEGIKRHYDARGELLEKFKKESLMTIISLFADFVQDPMLAPFSIQQICKIAYESFGSTPGKWYRASSVIMSLDVLNDKYGVRRIQNFKICTFNEGTIYEDQILKKALNLPEKEDKEKAGVENKDSETIDEDPSKVVENKDKDNLEGGEELSEPKGGHNEGEVVKENEEENKSKEEDAELKQEEPEEKKEWENSMIIFVTTRTGLSKHNIVYLPTIIRLLKLPQSIGVLGGKDSKGYYFIGFQGSELLYMDPHYVQEAYKNYGELEEKYKTYFQQKYFQVEITDIDTSIGFGFYIKDAEDYKDFSERLRRAIADDPNFLIGFEKITPSIELQQGDIIEIHELGEEFEVIG